MSDVTSADVFPDLVSPSEYQEAGPDRKAQDIGAILITALELASAAAMFVAVLVLRV